MTPIEEIGIFLVGCLACIMIPGYRGIVLLLIWVGSTYVYAFGFGTGGF